MNQLLRFAVIGTVGFVIDAGVLQLLVQYADANPFLGRIFSFLASASATWILNRRYTFEVAHRPTRREWLGYTTLMTFGAAINYGVFTLCLLTWDALRTAPWLAVAAGSLAGMGANFLSSRWLLARQP